MKAPPHNEQNIGGIHADEFLLGVLAAALGRNVGLRALDDLQKRLLHALARHVAGNGRPVALAGNLVDFVNVDNAPARGFKIIISILKKLNQNVFHILANIPRLGQCGGVGNGERHLEDTGKSTGKQRLAAAGRAYQQHIALFQLHAVKRALVKNPLVMIVHRHGQHLFGLLLADDIGVETLLDLRRRQQRPFFLPGFLHMLT